MLAVYIKGSFFTKKNDTTRSIKSVSVLIKLHISLRSYERTRQQRDV